MEGDQLGNQGMGRKIMLKCIFKKWDGGGGDVWVSLAWGEGEGEGLVIGVINNF